MVGDPTGYLTLLVTDYTSEAPPQTKTNDLS
jgi:hypothetical protein